jgi:N-acetylglucosaminyldiphosphoundecaprenol N-acetyl-beta-D-mannosaminyltransferase
MRVELLSVPLDVLTLEQTVERAVQAMRARVRTQHVAMNVAKFVKMRMDDVLRNDVIESDIVGIDGMGIIVGLRLAGIPVAERVAGVDLMMRLLQTCAQQGFRPYFLGGSAEVVREAAESAARQCPGLKFAGIRDGYFGPDQEARIVDEIRASGADCLFIGMPTPRKERLLHAYRDVLSVPFIMGVGGSFDVLAGKVARAPAWMQRTGLEWLYRIYQEPSRMWWRYLSTNTVYAGLLLRILVKRYAHRAV